MLHLNLVPAVLALLDCKFSTRSTFTTGKCIWFPIWFPKVSTSTAKFSGAVLNLGVNRINLVAVVLHVVSY
jgi:hypothetical protein